MKPAIIGVLAQRSSAGGGPVGPGGYFDFTGAAYVPPTSPAVLEFMGDAYTPPPSL